MNEEIKNIKVNPLRPKNWSGQDPAPKAIGFTAETPASAWAMGSLGHSADYLDLS